MNTKYLSIYPEWHCRKDGGLFFGCRLDFPCSIYDADAFASKHTYTDIRLTLGLIAFSVKVHIKSN